jgi:hypothetical protein
MTPRQIRASRVAQAHWPRLWAFAYPVRQPYEPLRRVALRVWYLGLRWALRDV